MPYITGQANSPADVLAALQSALAANGWANDGAVYYKGGCYVRLEAVNIATGTDVQNVLRLVAGNGVSGGALVDAAPSGQALGQIVQNTAYSVAWPAAYNIHINAAPDEVYVFVNYDVSYWQWIAFGKSPVPALPGSGVWSSGTFGVPVSGGADSGSRWPRIVMTETTGSADTSNGASFAPALFWNTEQYVNAVKGHTSIIHHGLDSGGWTFLAPASLPAAPYIAISPAAWNQEAILIPIRPMFARASSKVSLIAELAHARYIRNDNYDDGQILTLGTDHWRVYPWYCKNTAGRGGSESPLNHSGTFAVALRYDGP
ncbi:MAG: hypothetical protein LBQ81_12170 [Zoogloeaceae bacterium]|jgi:hypothetical protein|nr:hypothetical protein [Zoogloeaceae bacterium]